MESLTSSFHTGVRTPGLSPTLACSHTCLLVCLLAYTVRVGRRRRRLVCRMAVFSLLFPDVQAHCHKAIAEDDWHHPYRCIYISHPTRTSSSAAGESARLSDVHTCISGPSRGDHYPEAALSGIFLGPFKTLTHLLGISLSRCWSSLPIFFYLG